MGVCAPFAVLGLRGDNGRCFIIFCLRPALAFTFAFFILRHQVQTLKLLHARLRPRILGNSLSTPNLTPLHKQTRSALVFTSFAIIASLTHIITLTLPTMILYWPF